MRFVDAARQAGRRNKVTLSAYRYVRSRQRMLSRLPMYVPFSSGSLRQLKALTLLAAEQTPGLLAELARRTGASQPRRMSVDEFHAELGGSAPGALGDLFAMHGSDKCGRHNYHLVYAAILEQLVDVRGVLEVGLGSNNSDVPSNMGPHGRPGASLRAFRDYLPTAKIFGADIDERILFSEESITTFQVDQTEVESLRRLAARLPEQLDLVIDDGLHSPNANLGVLLLGLDKVRPGGWIVIEDIAPAAAPMWEVVAAVIGQRGECYLIDSRAALMFCVHC